MGNKILFIIEDLDILGSSGKNAMLNNDFTKLDGYIGCFGAIGGIGDLVPMLHGFKCKSVELGCDEIYITELPIYSTPRIYNKEMLDKIKPTKDYPLTKKSHVPFLLKKDILDYLGIQLIDSSNELKFKYKIQPLRTIYMENYIPHQRWIGSGDSMSNGGFFVYLDYYIRKYNKLEYFSPLKEEIKKKYIVFQYRNVKKEDQYNFQRGISKDYLLDIYYNLKSLLGDEYEFWKIGEEFSEEDKELEKLFDRIIPMEYGNLITLFKVIRNSSLMIGLHSGPSAIARMFRIPILEVSINCYTTRDINEMYSSGKRIPRKISPFNYIAKQGHERYSDQMWYERAGAPENTRYLETYNDITWGGFFTNHEPPPKKEYLKSFLEKNGLL